MFSLGNIGMASLILKTKETIVQQVKLQQVKLSYLTKLISLTSRLNTRLTRFLDDNQIRNENQIGLSDSYAPSDLILILYLLLRI